ncbi:ArsR/SmtB family transcription factor [Chryseolinea serpens]|uniref:ArsR/SmtB family transcription factor n=1 Tax=Chryseolinea serpens TaxID=947013 RepID=UPI0029371D0D|nr:metalloregulator ArsR/SmtB family transcription factor [Chryseolinea serpens]
MYSRPFADPTRREIIGLLAQRSMNVNELADNFNMTRTSVSQHVKILKECNLIMIRQQGRERICEAKLDRLSEVSNWVDQYRRFWTHQFKSLDKYLKKAQSDKNSKKFQ